MKQKFIIICCFTAFMFFSCGTQSKDNVYTGEIQKMYVGKSDSVAVKTLVDTFMGHIMEGRTADAVYMLYDGNHFDDNGDPCQLTEEQCQKLIAFYTQWNVTDYKIKNLSFVNFKNNEVRCQAFVDNLYTVSWSFKPMRIMGNWILCIKDSSEGDRPL